jgi:tetratricopeptide (TPR) repeat protein
MSAGSEAVAKGYQARQEGKLSLAQEYYADAARLYRDEDDILAYAHTIRHIADIYQEEHNARRAKPLYEEALEIYRSNPETNPLDLANAVRPYALLIEGEGQSSSAIELWEEARGLYQSLKIEPGISECDEHISHLQQSPSLR